MISFRKRLGLEIASHRNKRKLSQRKLAEKAEVSFSSVQNLEYGWRRTTLLVVCKICKALEVTAVEVLGAVGEHDSTED
jgi:transcriptional regulator with XRE-family HTH domain